MNLDANPTKEQLKELLAAHDDRAGDHMLWVTRGGDVELCTMPRDQAGAVFERAHPEMQIRYETLLAGNEYVGREAANCDEWVAHLFENLLEKWRKTKGQPEVAYVEVTA